MGSALSQVFKAKSLVEKENVTEQLKAAAPIEWVQKLNNIRNCAYEIVMDEVFKM